MMGQPILKGEEIFRLGMKRMQGDKEMTLWLTSEMQKIFQITANHEFLIFSMTVFPRLDQDFIPLGHPLTALFRAVVKHLKPVYGWMEPDFVGGDKAYSTWSPELTLPTIVPPWHINSGTTWVIGQPLSTSVESWLSPPNPDNRLLHIEEIAKHLFFVTTERLAHLDHVDILEGQKVFDDHRLPINGIRGALSKAPNSVP